MSQTDVAEPIRSNAAPQKRLKVLYLSHCGVDWLAEVLRRVGTKRGFAAEVTTGLHSELGRIKDAGADLVILDPIDLNWSIRLWDNGARASDESRLQIVDTLRGYYSAIFEELRNIPGGPLYLIKGVAPPAMPPGGRADFRRAVTFSDMAYLVNQHVRNLLRELSNFIFVDEQRLAAERGARDAGGSVSHTYGNFLSGMTEANASLVRSVTEEYLDAYTMWSSSQQIRCVVTDLDNTLWPGVVGEGGGIEGAQRRAETAVGTFGGIHQALGILKDRGILLATCSRNNRDVVLAQWVPCPEDPDLPMLLFRDDFVLHEIGWDPKPVSMQRILQSLGVTPKQVIFIDDDALQRTEMAEAYPDMHVMGADLSQVRRFLLTDPRLQVNILTADARNRAETAKLSVDRAALAASMPSRVDFLRGMQIRIRVRRATDPSSFARVSELLKRTNQFNLTGILYESDELERLVEEATLNIFTMEVTDRLGAYGLVGACVFRGDVVENVVVSCRVIGLEVGVPFFASCLRVQSRLHASISGSLRITERNTPCRGLYQDTGFECMADGRYMLSNPDRLARPDESIFSIEIDSQESIAAADRRALKHSRNEQAGLESRAPLSSMGAS